MKSIASPNFCILPSPTHDAVTVGLVVARGFGLGCYRLLDMRLHVEVGKEAALACQSMCQQDTTLAA
jgi:hypothetical protein